MNPALERYGLRTYRASDLVAEAERILAVQRTISRPASPSHIYAPSFMPWRPFIEHIWRPNLHNAWTLIGASAAGVGANTFSTGAFSTVGADLIICYRTTYQSSIATLSDSQTNSWTSLTPQSVLGDAHSTLFYKFAPATNASHNFTLTGSGIYAVLLVLAFSGGASFDKEAGTSGSGFTTPARTGAFTPTNDNALIVCGSSVGTGSLSALESMTIEAGHAVNYAGGNNFSGMLAWKTQTTAVSINPGFNFASGTTGGIVAAVFNMTAAAAQDPSQPNMVAQMAAQANW